MKTLIIYTYINKFSEEVVERNMGPTIPQRPIVIHLTGRIKGTDYSKLINYVKQNKGLLLLLSSIIILYSQDYGKESVAEISSTAEHEWRDCGAPLSSNFRRTSFWTQFYAFFFVFAICTILPRVPSLIYDYF